MFLGPIQEADERDRARVLRKSEGERTRESERDRWREREI